MHPDAVTPVREARPEDVQALSALYAASVRGIGPRDYSAAQVEAWAGLTPSAARLSSLMADGRRRWVAVDAADDPVAFADLQTDGHIDFLYCAPGVAGTGVAGALYEALEDAAQAAGMTRLTAYASEAATRFLTRRGFAVVERRDLEVAGVAIHNYAVEKTL